MTLAFQVGPIPVRVTPWLLFIALTLGLGAQHGPVAVVAQTAGFLATIFAHELAHAAVARSFGAPAEVHLTLARPGLGSWLRPLSPLRKVAAHLAGPAMSLVIAAVAFAIAHWALRGSGVGADALRHLGWMNLGWGLLNVVPILPLEPDTRSPRCWTVRWTGGANGRSAGSRSRAPRPSDW